MTKAGKSISASLHRRHFYEARRRKDRRAAYLFLVRCTK